MKNLWTPWRMEHVLGQTTQPGHCLFEPPGDERSAKAYLLLFRNHDLVMLLNRYPYTNGHLLVAPRRHVASITELSDQEAGNLMVAIRHATAILDKHLHPDGFNIGCNLGATAGAGIAEHLHFHIVPRWEGDHNFMTVISEIRTIPEHIDITFAKLLPDFTTLHAQLQP